MTSKVTTYSMLNEVAVLDGLRIIGFWDGDDAVSITPGADVGTGLIGADGSGIFSQSADKSADINIKLQHTSEAHRRLLEKLSAQQQGRLDGFPFSIKELKSGKGGQTDKCFIKQQPTEQAGNTASVMEWVLWAQNWDRELTNL